MASNRIFFGVKGLLSGEIDDVVNDKGRFVQSLLISLGFGKLTNNRDYFVFDQMLSYLRGLGCLEEQVNLLPARTCFQELNNP